MRHRATRFRYPLALAVLLFASVPHADAQASAATCDTAGQRVGCGFIGITRAQCEQRDCCWDAVEPNDNLVPFCFNPNRGIASVTPAPTPVPPGVRGGNL
jgi:hypothetical protein